MTDTRDTTRQNNSPQNPNTPFSIPSGGDTKKTEINMSRISANSHQDTLSRHVTFFVVSGVLFVVLLALSIVLVITTLQRNDRTVSQNASVSAAKASLLAQQIKEITDQFTGGPDTPASKSRINKETVTPNTWLKKNFGIRDVLSDDVTCKTLIVCGPDADPDGDSLNNLQEYNFGTDPNDSDTDKDGLSDGNELLLYYTSPVLKDSNTNGVSDGQDVVNCTDPIKTGIMTTDRLLTLSTQVALYTLNTNTITLFQQNGATTSDISTRAVIKANCDTASATLTGVSASANSTISAATSSSK